MEITKTVKLMYDDVPVEKTLTFKEINKEQAEYMMVNNHYSKKWNGNFGKINVGVFEGKILYGAAVYGAMMNPMSYSNFNKDFEQDSIVELNRLWVDDYLGKKHRVNSIVVIIQNYKGTLPKYKKPFNHLPMEDLDVAQFIRQPIFDYYGYTERMFYEHKETKIMYHSVAFENTKSSGSFIKLNEEMADGMYIPFIVRSYRYVMPLYKNVVIEMKKIALP